MSRLQKWGIALALTAAAVAVSYVFVDRPLSFFAHDNLVPYKIFVRMQAIPEPFAGVGVAVLLVVGIWSLAQPLPRYALVAAVWSASVIVTAAIKNQLKYVFGRTWPETWVNNNPSLIRDGAFGFNPLHGGAGYESFPSGHTAAICAAAAVLWICYPRLRVLYAAAVAAVAIGLVGANYHFLSDMIAGGFLGASVGIIAVGLAGLDKPARS